MRRLFGFLLLTLGCLIGVRAFTDTDAPFAGSLRDARERAAVAVTQGRAKHQPVTATAPSRPAVTPVAPERRAVVGPDAPVAAAAVRSAVSDTAVAAPSRWLVYEDVGDPANHG